jgi:polar amino acid transport system substrate-binding protein
MSMKPWLSIISVTVALFAAVALGVFASDEILLTTGDFPPYEFEGAADPGPFPALIAAIFKEEGLTVKIVFYPWKRAENEVREGRAFATFPYRVTAERQQEFDFSDPFYSYAAKFFYRKKFHPDGNAIRKIRGSASLRDWWRDRILV